MDWIFGPYMNRVKEFFFIFFSNFNIFLTIYVIEVMTSTG